MAILRIAPFASYQHVIQQSKRMTDYFVFLKVGCLTSLYFKPHNFSNTNQWKNKRSGNIRCNKNFHYFNLVILCSNANFAMLKQYKKSLPVMNTDTK